eukprot:NODE_6678_length_495_cov_16.883408_g5892_i0.p1 GENE.NODE_6678_length_495_cov_16.883408_g5892_i0~~NODE_6678_length_495_cov_16.883408_g5892_i0.p1  ORF type:complete len:157 (-),score=2.81 NODE_6678_length_495_cov_16.883408_g5892_i0:19-489(-)
MKPFFIFILLSIIFLNTVNGLRFYSQKLKKIKDNNNNNYYVGGGGGGDHREGRILGIGIFIFSILLLVLFCVVVLFILSICCIIGEIQYRLKLNHYKNTNEKIIIFDEHSNLMSSHQKTMNRMELSSLNTIKKYFEKGGKSDKILFNKETGKIFCQ